MSLSGAVSIDGTILEMADYPHGAGVILLRDLPEGDGATLQFQSQNVAFTDFSPHIRRMGAVTRNVHWGIGSARTGLHQPHR